MVRDWGNGIVEVATRKNTAQVWSPPSRSKRRRRATTVRVRARDREPRQPDGHMLTVIHGRCLKCAARVHRDKGGGMSDEFPCDSFKAAARHLRRPFTPAAVRFKVQATWPKDKPTGGLIVAYIDARLVTERLNLVVPHLWADAYRPVGTARCGAT
jgi:hypothetical protein